MKRELTSVDAGIGGRDPELGLDEFGDESDESGDDGAFCRVGEADEEEGHVAEDPHGSFGEVWERAREKSVNTGKLSLLFSGSQNQTRRKAGVLFLPVN